MSSSPSISKLSEENAEAHPIYHNLMPFNPMDVSLIKQSPDAVLLKLVSKEAMQGIFPEAKIADAGCNDTNWVRRIAKYRADHQLVVTESWRACAG